VKIAPPFVLPLLAAMSTPLLVTAAEPEPPIAKRVPHQIVAPHGHTRDDPYYWLRER
jgi:oligopeptidase B